MVDYTRGSLYESRLPGERDEFESSVERIRGLGVDVG